ncbi:hypothetical protein AJ87_07215 [Rhizobium yanglingense]|nr:hypothetical protein AJ87_07215 [Rhizobium yanglingense]
MGAKIMGCAEKLVDVALAVTDIRASARIAKKSAFAVEIAPIVEPSKLLQAVIAMLARQVIEGVPQEMHVGAVEKA